MTKPFTMTRELTDAQCVEIDLALLSHGIDVARGDGLDFDWLCNQVEHALALYVDTRYDRDDSRRETLAQIAKIQKALMGMGSTAFRVLSEATTFTVAQQRLDATGMYGDLREALENQWTGRASLPKDLAERMDCNMPYDDLFSIAIQALSEACNLATSTPAPENIYGDGDIFSGHVAEARRPNKQAERELIRTLAKAFELSTGRKATDSESGPFDSFVVACMNIVSPRVGAEGKSFRSIIRTTLKTRSQHGRNPTQKN